MSSFVVDKAAANAVIKDMDSKVYEYSKRLAATKVKVRNLEKLLRETEEQDESAVTGESVKFRNEIEDALKQANLAVQHIQDCVDCFTLVRTYCIQLVERVTDVDRMGVLLINSNTLNMKELTDKQHTNEPYVTGVEGNKFYNALYNDLSADEYTRLAELIGEETVKKLMSVPQTAEAKKETATEQTIK